MILSRSVEVNFNALTNVKKVDTGYTPVMEISVDVW